MRHAPVLSALISGTIAYRDGAGEQVGCERFELSSHAGGHILRAFCEMDDVSLLRDVSIAMDQAWRPREGYCRVNIKGRLAAAMWIAADAQGVTAECQLSDGGRVSQRLASAEPPQYFGLHPLQGDALIAQIRGQDDPGAFRRIEAVTNSISPNGDEDLHAVLMGIDVAFIGYEPVTVAAGSFTARRFALRWRDDWPSADLWVRESDCVFLLMRWAQTENWYELAAINDRAPLLA
jgi:hypothetical protein